MQMWARRTLWPFIHTLLEYFYKDKATQVIGKTTNVTGLVNIGCSRQSALELCYDEEKYTTSCGNTLYDLTISIWQHMQEFSNLKWTASHIKGHPDNNVDYEELDMWAKINCNMDVGAKALSHNISHLPWTTHIITHMINKDLKQLICDFYSGTDLLQYWDKKQHQYSSKTADDIDWDSLKKPMHSILQNYQQEVTKHVSGFFGTGKNMVRWKKWKTSNCSRSNALKEEKSHIIKGLEPTATALFDKKMTKWSEWLDEKNTEIGIQAIIIDRLKNWKNNKCYN